MIGRSRVPVLPGIRQDQNMGRGASSSVLLSGVVFASDGARSERGSVAVPQVLPWEEGFPPSFPIPHVEQGTQHPLSRDLLCMHVSPHTEPLPDARYARGGLADGVVAHLEVYSRQYRHRDDQMITWVAD